MVDQNLPDHIIGMEFNQLEVATNPNVCDNLISLGLLSMYTCRKLCKVFGILPMGENNL